MIDGRRRAADQTAPAVAAPRRRRLVSPLTRRILSINIGALLVLVFGVLYSGRYQDNLLDAELASMQTQAEIFAAALGEGAYETLPNGATALRRAAADPMLRRLVQPTQVRARLYGADGAPIADSRTLFSPDSAAVKVVELPPPGQAPSRLTSYLLDLYEWALSRMPGRRVLPHYVEPAHPQAKNFPEVLAALDGEPKSALRTGEAGGLVLSVAVPVQRFKQVLGAVQLTRRGEAIDAAVREVRFDILKVFGVALGVTILLSLYLGRSIVRPLRQLASAADRVRLAPGREQHIPDFAGRGDEIGALAGDLRAMTEALWVRLDAIESFAADVAHEIKNPLTSLRSAVETAVRVADPEQQRQLMQIIEEDVKRLDRLISDISDASRLDAELSRQEFETIDLERLLAALAEVYRTSGAGAGHRLTFTVKPPGPFRVQANESRLVQVIRNLLGNAFSFSPPDGAVRLALRRDGDMLAITVEDDGPGIPESALPRIFERFYSERPEGERFGTHSGLGLSISRQIVEAHGGVIDAQNVKGADGAVAGARFTVRLPAAR